MDLHIFCTLHQLDFVLRRLRSTDEPLVKGVRREDQELFEHPRHTSLGSKGTALRLEHDLDVVVGCDFGRPLLRRSDAVLRRLQVEG